MSWLLAALLAASLGPPDEAGATLRGRVTDPLGGKQGFFYDLRGRLVKHVDEEGGTRTFSYAKTGVLSQVVDENGHASTYGVEVTARGWRQLMKGGRTGRSRSRSR